MMPSPRRLRLLVVVALAFVITTLFFSSQMRSNVPQDTQSKSGFFGKTMNGLEKQHGQGQIVMSGTGEPAQSNPKDHDGDGIVNEEDEKLAREMADRLRAAEQKAKDLANAKAPLKPDTPSNVVGVGSSAGGQNKKGKYRGTEQEADEEVDQETEEEHEIEVTLNKIFKKSPVIIFSKSYCPYSKRAKGVLLEKYTIDPTPYVVELDEHPLGKQLQAKLGEMTGRKTVPNIMINGKSVGGSDEIAELDSRRTLIDKFKAVGGKRLAMKERFVGNPKEI